MNIIELLGWVGAITLLYGYYLIQTEQIVADDKWYIALNIIGSFFLLINTWYHGAYPSMVANFIWFIVGIYGLSVVWYT
jgi:hypothetical protein